MDILGFILLGPLCAPRTWMSVSFAQLGKFSAVISSNMFSTPFSFFSFWDSYYVNVVLFEVVIEIWHLLLFLKFFFCCSTWFCPLPCLPHHWSILLNPLISFSFPVLYFSYQLLHSSILTIVVLFFSICLLKISLSSSILQSREHLYNDYIEFFIR